MDVIEGMRIFAAVAEAGSFTAAAGKLNISKALASKYVGQLEDRLGLRLLNRDTRNVSLTGVGMAYLERCNRLLADFDELETIIHDQKTIPSGEIRVSAPTHFGEAYLPRLVSAFLDENPIVSVDLSLSDRYVNLVEERFDLALRIGVFAESRLNGKRLASTQHIVCASPQYVKAHGVPERPSELIEHHCIIDKSIVDADRWTFHRDSDVDTVPVKGRLKVNSARAIREFLLTGDGIGLCPDYLVSEDIRAGALQQLFPDYTNEDHGIYAVYPHNRPLGPTVRIFVDFLAKHVEPGVTSDLS